LFVLTLKIWWKRRRRVRLIEFEYQET
jgi:hypothetical protein